VFMAVYAENAAFAQAEGFIHGKAAIRALYAPAFAPGFARDSLTLAHVQVRPISAEAVLVEAVYHNTRDGAVTRRGTSSLLMVLVGGQWRIVHDHSS